MALLEEGEQRVREIALGSEYYLHFWRVGGGSGIAQKDPHWHSSGEFIGPRCL